MLAPRHDPAAQATAAQGSAPQTQLRGEMPYLFSRRRVSGARRGIPHTEEQSADTRYIFITSDRLISRRASGCLGGPAASPGTAGALAQRGAWRVSSGAL